MRRILITTESLNAGGAERQIVEMVKGLHSNHNFQVKILSLTKGGHYDETVRPYTEVFYPCNVSKDWKYAATIKKTYKYLQENKFDIVHSFSLNDSILINLVKSRFRFRWINGTIRDTDKNRNRRQLQKLLILKFSKYVISNSYKGLETYKIRKSRYKGVIYNGIDIDRFKSTRVTLDNSLQKSFNIGVIANLSSYKDYYTIFNAMEKLSDYPFFLHVIGDGPKMNEYKNYVHSIKLDKKITFYGKIGNIESVINNFDCGLLCSYVKSGEGISNAVLEFMASSLPVIATNVGAIPEIIDGKNNGLLIEAGNYLQLAQKIKYLYSSLEERKRIGINARKTVIEKFNYKKMLNEYQNYYEFVLKN